MPRTLVNVGDGGGIMHIRGSCVTAGLGGGSAATPPVLLASPPSRVP